jgi:alkylation response protein AidB-like acyl-CoA dehydrogenase
VNFGHTDDERIWLRELTAFIDGYHADHVAALRDEMRRLEVERFSPTFNAALARRGWLGMGWPVAGARAASETERWMLHEQIDSAGLPFYGVEQNEALGWMLVRNGPEPLAAQHLPHIVDGTWNYAAGYSEPEAGSDLFSLKSRGTRHGAHYVVSGSKLWTSAGHIADWIFAIVRTDLDSAGARGLSVMLIDTKSPGVEIRPVHVLGGWRVNACFFDDVEVPAANIIGEEHEGARVISTALDAERSMSFGGRESRLLLARFLHRFTGRSQELDEPTLERLGRLVADLEAERLLNLRIVAMAERGVTARAEASIDKVHSSELAQRVAAFVAENLGPDAQLAHAGDALAAAAEEALRTSTVLTIIGGTSEVQRSAIAQSGLGLPRGA